MKNKSLKILVGILLPSTILIGTFSVSPNVKNTSIQHSIKNNLKVTEPSTLEDLRKMSVDDIASLSKFDGRNFNITTPVKNQGSQNICWAYSIAAASETNMLYKEGILDNTSNNNFGISSRKIDYAVSKRNGSNDKLGLTNEDIIDRPTNNGTISTFFNSQLLIQQNGIVIGNPNDTSGERAAWLEDIVNVPHEDNEIKKAVAKYGAVTFEYFASPNIPTSYYSPSNKINHVSTVVGWDDNYSKDKFGPTKPKNNGAWIVKNSWGDNIFDNGYNYLSYESNMETIVAFNYANKNTYENMYYYDGRGGMGEAPEIGNAEVGVIFPVKKASYDKIEKLKGITFGVIGNNVRVNAKIYTNVNANPANRYSNINSPESQTLVFEQESETYPNLTRFGGVYTMRLNKEIELPPNSYFSIVLQAINDDGTARILFSGEPNSTNDLTYYKNRNGSWTNCAVAGRDWARYYVAAIKGLTVTENKNGSIDNDIAYADVSYSDSSFNYSDKKLEPAPNVNFQNQALTVNNDYTVEHQQIIEPNPDNNNVVGTLVTTIKGKNLYKGKKVVYSIINKGSEPPIDIKNATYDKQTKTINIKVTDNFDAKISNYSDIDLPEGWQFERDGTLVEGSNNNNLKYVKADASYYQNNVFKVIVDKTITANNINDVEVLNNNLEFKYTSSEIKPQVNLKFHGKQLVQNQDYSLSYKNNVDAGTGTIIVTGLKYFKNEKTIDFKILKVKNVITSFKNENGKLVTSSLFGDRNVQYKYYNDKECLNELKGKPNQNGIFYVRAYIPATNNYEEVWSDAVQYEYRVIEKNNNSNSTIIMATTIPISAIALSALVSLLVIRNKRKNNSIKE